MRSILMTLALMGLIGFGAIGCEDDGAAEDAGEKIDEAMDDAGDAIKDAADDMEDAMDGGN